MKIGCVIQGDIRRGTALVLAEMCPLFDLVILSTWLGQEDVIPDGKFLLLQSEKPQVPGLTNRNLQRLLTAKGIHLARNLECDYVLKWRSDMLPSKLNVNDLLCWTNFDVPSGMRSRIAMPAFRNLSVEPDWFSSIPDMFAFGHISDMEMLWGDKGFNYALDLNVPEEMLSELSGKFSNLSSLYCPESELYAIFKDRLQKKIGKKLTHHQIAADYFRLFDHGRLGIFWFGRERGFRAIAQAQEHRWWTEKNWLKRNAIVNFPGYPVKGAYQNLQKFISPFMVKLDEFRQSIAWMIRS
jgi:hypothetical protein